MVPFSDHIGVVFCSLLFREGRDLPGVPQVEQPQVQRALRRGAGVLHVLQRPAQLLERVAAVLEPPAPEPVQLHECNKNCVIFDLPGRHFPESVRREVSALPAGVVSAEADVGVEQAHEEDGVDVVALPAALLDTVGVDAGGVVGAAAEEELLPVVLDLDQEVPAEGVAAAKVEPRRLVVEGDAGEFGGGVLEVLDLPVGGQDHVEEVDQQPLVGRVAEDGLESGVGAGVDESLDERSHDSSS